MPETARGMYQNERSGQFGHSHHILPSIHIGSQHSYVENLGYFDIDFLRAQPIRMHSELLFEKKSLIPALQQLLTTGL